MYQPYPWWQQHRNSFIAWTTLVLILSTTFIADAGPIWAQNDATQTHTVQAGETLSEIAAAYGVALADLMAINGIGDANQIYVGQELRLPDNAVRIGGATIDIPTYTVATGETLSQIAQRYGLSTTRLMFLNGISDADAIYIGQVLRLPVEVSTPEATTEQLASDDATVTATVTATVMASATRPTSPSSTITPTIAASATTLATTTGTATAVNLPTTHIVQPGETLSEIAKQYGLAMQALLDANGIQNADAIYSGQELRLPGAPTPTATVTPSPSSTVTPVESPTASPTPAAALPAESNTAAGPALTSLNRTYTVRLNDNLGLIAQRLGVNPLDLQRINRIYASRELIVGAELIIPATGDDLRVVQPAADYTVQPGDSLSVIAKNFGLSLADLMVANYIDNPNNLAVGQELIIPKPAPTNEGSKSAPPRVGPQRSGFYSYAVQPGETLSELATAFDSTMLALLDYNGLPNAETVYQGLELRIPYGPPPLPLRLPPVATSGTSFLVSLSRQECWLFWGKVVQRRWRCSTGYGEFVTRTGNFAVQSKIENAKSNAYQLDMPYWLGIYNVGDYENGIHGLPVSWATGKKIWTSLVGQPATFGCAMLSDEDAAELFKVAYIGMPVYIIN